MPNGIIPDESLGQCLADILGSAAALLIPWEALLFTNDIVPNGATVLADLEEPTWASYARRTLAPASWSAPVVSGGYARSEWGTATVDFDNTASATETPHGYAIYDSGLGLLRVVERFEVGDIRPIAAGESVRIVPRVSFRSQTPLE